MPSAYSTIGVPIVDSEADYDAWAQRAAAEGEVVPVAAGEYRILSSESGAQLWACVDRGGVVVLAVVADPAVVEGEPAAGGVVKGTFRLSGRIAGHP